jgi:2-isopropylmalate synthase
MIWDAFREAYHLEGDQRFGLVEYGSAEVRRPGQQRKFVGRVTMDGQERSISGSGNGLISGVLAALKADCGVELEVVDYHEHALRHGSDAQAAAYVECRTPDGRTVFGVGIDTDVSTASVKSVLSAANGAAIR